MRCGVSFSNYARLVICAPQTDIPRYLEQNVDDAVTLGHSNSEDIQQQAPNVAAARPEPPVRSERFAEHGAETSVAGPKTLTPAVFTFETTGSGFACSVAEERRCILARVRFATVS